MMFELLDPTPDDISRVISDGISRSNEALAIRREDFAIVQGSGDLLIGGVTASQPLDSIWLRPQSDVHPMLSSHQSDEFLAVAAYRRQIYPPSGSRSSDIECVVATFPAKG